jgi:hypothetical protein
MARLPGYGPQCPANAASQRRAVRVAVLETCFRDKWPRRALVRGLIRKRLQHLEQASAVPFTCRRHRNEEYGAEGSSFSELWTVVKCSDRSAATAPRQTLLQHIGHIPDSDAVKRGGSHGARNPGHTPVHQGYPTSLPSAGLPQ